MVSPYSIDIEKHKKNVFHSERRIAQGAIAEGDYDKLGTGDQYVVAATLNSKNLGVALNTVTTADVAAYAEFEGNRNRVEVSVALIGIAPVLAGTEIQRSLAANEYVKSDANGDVIPLTGDGTDQICGMVLRDTAAGEETHVLILHIPPND